MMITSRNPVNGIRVARIHRDRPRFVSGTGVRRPPRRSSFSSLTFFGGEIGPKSIYMIDRGHHLQQLRRANHDLKLKTQGASLQKLHLRNVVTDTTFFFRPQNFSSESCNSNANFRILTRHDGL
jgi:hypothetical protein